MPLLFHHLVVVRAHMVAAVKFWEFPELREYKVRIVGNGGQVRDSQGRLYNAKEFYTLPVGLEMVRYLNAHGLLMEVVAAAEASDEAKRMIENQETSIEAAEQRA